MSKSELQQACEEKGITISSVHMGLEWEPDPKYPMDVWSCTLQYDGRSATFPFKTGIGHRVPGMGWKAEGRDKWVHLSGNVVHGLQEGIAAGALVVKRERNPETKQREIVGPSVADVMRAYLDESQACSTTFDDWCSNYGKNNDSLKALNTYLSCQRSGSRLIKLLGYTLVEELTNKEH